MQSKFHKIYVLCPIGTKTGGTELLHQLVYQINQIAHKQIAHIVYLGDLNEVKPAPAFKEYIGSDWLTLNDVEDSNENVIVIPETSLMEFNKFKNAKRYIWWLSVDNFYNTNYFSRLYRQYGLLHTLSGYLKGVFKNRTKCIKKADINMYQSYYAKVFLRNNKIPDTKLAYLSDYVNDLYTADVNKALQHAKKDIILYNPKKGYEFTSKLIAASPSLCWVPLINLTNDEVKEKLISSKIYVDFGTHPGKDRFPREAAISGCCILTDKKGAAKFSEDVRIPEEYKFEDKDENVSRIIDKIKFCLTNYNDVIKDFGSYREYILGEKKSFKSDCEKIFFVNCNNKLNI